MISYEYYISEFGGTKIEEESVFDEFSDRAERYVLLMTGRRGSEEEIADGVCAVCEYLAENAGNDRILSESADGVSITYSEKDQNRAILDILKLYLPPMLLYRGI